MHDFGVTPAHIRSQRLGDLRTLMHSHGYAATVILSSDPHMSEYLSECYQGRAWLSGFTGSVGTLVVTQDFLGLWTDSRYWLQAPKQLEGTGIALMPMEQGKPTFGRFLADTLPAGASVAIDGSSLPLVQFEELQEIFVSRSIALVDHDLLHTLWHDRPSLPQQPIYVHDDVFVDKSAKDKLTLIRQKMHDLGADHHLISSLDDIAWLTNLRGSDVAFNPVFLAHLLIGERTATLCVDDHKLRPDVKAALVASGITLAPYEQASALLAELSGVLLIDPAKVAKGTLAHTPSDLTLCRAPNPSTLLKAIKSVSDIRHIKDAMRADGVALCEFFARLEDSLAQGERLTELDVDRMLLQARSRQPHFVGHSFDTIAGFLGNGAVVHYRATPQHHLPLIGDGLLLIDSGAQYKNGTTDITRMLGIGHVSMDARRDVTYVLKAHIALARAHFPVGIPSMQLDVLARVELWRAGLDYGHGTGHGVGYFLGVHEGPQVISRNAAPSPDRIMLEGMITSNEPGLYRTDQWGVRLENLVACVRAHSGDFGEFLRFETLTLCPFDNRLILPELLTDIEKSWLNDYHQTVATELAPLTQGRAKQWLLARTAPI